MKERIYTIANLLPAVCLLLSAVILLVGYPLNKKETIKMGEKLKQINR